MTDTLTHDADRPRLVLVLDQPDYGHAGVLLGLVGPTPLPRLCTGDGDVIPVPLGRASFPSQLARYDDRRIRRWTLLVLAALDRLTRLDPHSTDTLGYLLAARAMLRHLRIPIEGGEASLLVRVRRVRPVLERQTGVNCG